MHKIQDINSPGCLQPKNGPYWEISLKHTILDDPYYSENNIFITPYTAWSDLNPSGYTIPGKQILLADATNGGWKWVIDINPIQTAKSIYRLKVMVIRSNPSSRPISPFFMNFLILCQHSLTVQQFSESHSIFLIRESVVIFAPC